MGPVPAGRLPSSTKIGNYHLKRVIAAGGMGVVYEAIQEHPRRTVALKIMKQGIASRSALRRFEYESQILARLRHPGIAQVYEAGMHEDPDGVGQVPFFAMEYVPAARDIIEYAESNDLDIRERLELFAKVCDAVYHGHQKGIVHRDLKPPNILVDATGQPKIIDFGVARSTDSDLAVTTLQTNVGQLVGTMQYMSPEQIDADPLNIDTRSDVFALGVVLYRLLTGRLPYDVGGCSIYEATRIIREEHPARPSAANPGLGGDVETIVLHALEKDRSRRYQSALELALDIRRYLTNHAILARPPSTVYQLTTFAKRNRVLVGGVAGIFGALVLGVIAFSWQARIAGRQRDVAEDAKQVAERRFDQIRTLAGEFMFDFHNAIQTLDGALPARELVVTTALEYLDSLAAEAGDNLELKRDLASAYDRVGDIRGGLRNPSLGDTAGALENYRTALALRQEATAADPDDLVTLKAVSSSHMRIGDMLENTSDVTGALTAYREALAIREEVARLDPEHRLRASTAMLEVGGALNRTGELSAARDYCERALAMRKMLLALAPDNNRIRRSLSVAQQRLGRLIADAGHTLEAVTHYQEAMTIRASLLAGEPESGRFKRDLALVHYYLGDAYLDQGRPSVAMEHLDQFLASSLERVDDNPGSARASRDLALAHEVVGRAAAMMNDYDGALVHFQAFRDLVRSLSQDHSADTYYQKLTAQSYQRLGELARARGKPGPAVEDLKIALDITNTLASADPADFDFKLRRAELLVELGAALTETGTPSEARRNLEASRVLYESLVGRQPENLAWRARFADALSALARLSMRIGEGETARTYTEQALAQTDRERPRRLRDLAAAYHLLGQDTRAAETIRDALAELDPTDAWNDTLRAALEADAAIYSAP